MARAKKNAKKKSSRIKKSAALKLKKLKPKDYEIVWDKRRESCHFGHKSGIGGEIGSGINDVIEVYTDGKYMYVLSLNYTEGYACVEAFDGEPGECAQLCFALPKDIEKLIGKKLKDSSPSDVMTAMYVEMQECEA